MISERKYNSSSRQKKRREAEVDEKLRSLNISLCQYLQWYFNPDTTALQVLTHRPNLFNGHWPSFEHVLNLIVEVGRRSGSKGRDRINTSTPTYVPSQELTPDRLTSDCIDEGLDKTADDNQSLAAFKTYCLGESRSMASFPVVPRKMRTWIIPMAMVCKNTALSRAHSNSGDDLKQNFN
ncbi:BZ3500_MvSof-1268-A1-R1_Chr8-2g10084 [Microbotryum saponariae]|uniref:BZ3500_MvSof-1268-A1-R1_Chr8-2g10084 protein n=1 Tax=Microbotryum saponariae TaxID=289078 RepID=A0A2X0N3U5_9BASI|nr:BZ3500_MvSof-1268-A1-R1_Chr8-2g10084 [Microbotryum saponariae]SDA01752.1 BZ3501_MvSof-1269-A2-R1_Chr8-2g09835 [Microbotryum saponariae]